MGIGDIIFVGGGVWEGMVHGMIHVENEMRR